MLPRIMTGPTSLKEQLEQSRFSRALEITEGMAARRVLLTTMELARLNNMLMGKPTEFEPWRQEPISLRLPSGNTAHFAILGDPKLNTRDKLHKATELAESGHVIDAAVELYVGLVMLHAFQDANRRTAVLAAHYFLTRYGVPVSGVALHDLGIGDLREPGQIEKLKDGVQQIAKFKTRRGD